MDNQDDEAVSLAAALGCDAANAADQKARRERKKEKKKERKVQKKQKKDSLEKQTVKEPEKAVQAPPSTAATSAPTTPVKNGRYGPRGPYKKREKHSGVTPKSGTKRKRDSRTLADNKVAIDKSIMKGDSWLGHNFLEDLKKSMGNVHGDFSQQVEVGSSPASPPKKMPGRPPGKKVGAEAVAKKTFRMIKTPVPVHSVASMLLSGSNRTPVPLPETSSHVSTHASSELKPNWTTTTHPESQVLVTETPPSKMQRTPVITTRQPAIAFSLTEPTAPAATNLKNTKKGATPTKTVVSSEGSVNPLTSSQTAFTSSNLSTFKQPLNDKPKARLRGVRAMSIGTTSSDSSSSTHPDIRDMLKRVAKPYTRSGAPDDPFTLSEPKKKQAPREAHAEAKSSAFIAAYETFRKTVNFSDESEYYEEYLELKYDSNVAGALPCLKKATGCSTKSETLLRLQKEDSDGIIKVLTTTEAVANAAEDNIARCSIAENTLKVNIAARLPVPIGNVEGSYRLYCPAYTSTHVDKYGYGQRRIIINSIPGSSPHYTARLCIPPRSMPFNIIGFDAPPHASFRTTVLKTVAEGYKLDVIFLGNGFLKLRVDVHLLLMGKRADGGRGRAQEGVWEFLGVSDQALVWEPVVDELEREGRRLFKR
ncbi:hypothetical protein BDW02DRAFT_615033 [Decorospora gaudefroyi]|uniref:Uncharacterized protein n=1 Tax=Decorospora gaudefroyi TaxID=184978 RepID=A0A6A5KSM6_9PLEO|nr:hypothetical protein BDW02DRAFT_615033 [Decorospora gaudefroyi]